MEPTLLILAVGGFGARVADRLAARYPGSDVLDATGGSHSASWPARDVLVVAAEHDPVPLVDAVEGAAFAWRRPWFPVLLDHPYLRCGPVVVPSATACHRCFRRRRLQHAKTPDLYDEKPPPPVAGTAATVRGYADHHVGLAAGLAVRAVRDALTRSPEPPGGWVRTVGLVDAAVSRAGVVAVDGCQRCRPRRHPDDGWRNLAAALDLAPYPLPARTPEPESPLAG